MPRPTARDILTLRLELRDANSTTVKAAQALGVAADTIKKLKATIADHESARTEGMAEIDRLRQEIETLRKMLAGNQDLLGKFEQRYNDERHTSALNENIASGWQQAYIELQREQRRAVEELILARAFEGTRRFADRLAKPGLPEMPAAMPGQVMASKLASIPESPSTIP